MWDHFSGVTQRLKDIAAELASPQFEEDEQPAGPSPNPKNDALYNAVPKKGTQPDSSCPVTWGAEERRNQSIIKAVSDSDGICLPVNVPSVVEAASTTPVTGDNWNSTRVNRLQGQAGPPLRSQKGTAAGPVPPTRPPTMITSHSDKQPSETVRGNSGELHSSVSSTSTVSAKNVPPHRESEVVDGVQLTGYTVAWKEEADSVSVGQSLEKHKEYVSSSAHEEVCPNAATQSSEATPGEIDPHMKSDSDVCGATVMHVADKSNQATHWTDAVGDSTAVSSVGSPQGARIVPNDIAESVNTGLHRKKEEGYGTTGACYPSDTEVDGAQFILQAGEMTTGIRLSSQQGETSLGKTNSELLQTIKVLERDKAALVGEMEQTATLLSLEKNSLQDALRKMESLHLENMEQGVLIRKLTEELNTLRQQHDLARDEDSKNVQNEAVETFCLNEERKTAISDELISLRQQLQDMKEQREAAINRLKEEERKAYDHQVSELLKNQEERTRIDMENLHNKIIQLQQQFLDLSVEKEKLEEERQRDRKIIVEAESNATHLSSKLTTAENHILELQKVIAESSQKSSDNEGSSLVSALTERKRELEREKSQLLESQQQMSHIITRTLVNANVEFPPSEKEGAPITFDSLIKLMVSEFHRLLDIEQQARRNQMEMENTYENARMVNTTLSQQVSEAWKTIGALREELSVREQVISSMKQQHADETREHRRTQEQLANVMNELEKLKDCKPPGCTSPHVNTGIDYSAENGSQGQKAAKLWCSQNSGAAHEEKMDWLEEEAEALRHALRERDEELIQAHQANRNLQQVLDTFTSNKENDVEERTAYLQVEIDELRDQLAKVEQQLRDHNRIVEDLNMNHRREIAAKNVEISSLHRKHNELRKALGETARQLNGESLIDKRVISHLTVNYVHAFVAQKPEADEILKVLSGLLNWDEATQERAGLLPGPTNPKPGQQHRRGGARLIGGLVSSMWRGSGSGAKAVQSVSQDDNKPPTSIAELWVDFLMRESETAMQETHTDAAEDMAPCGVSGGTPAFNSSEKVEDAVK